MGIDLRVFWDEKSKKNISKKLGSKLILKEYNTKLFDNKISIFTEKRLF